MIFEKNYITSRVRPFFRKKKVKKFTFQQFNDYEMRVITTCTFYLTAN